PGRPLVHRDGRPRTTDQPTPADGGGEALWGIADPAVHEPGPGEAFDRAGARRVSSDPPRAAPAGQTEGQIFVREAPMEMLVEVGLGNALGATVLAVVVAAIACCCRRPAVVHSLWLLVVLRLLVPPFVTVSMPWPSLPAVPNAAGGTIACLPEPAPANLREA